MGGRASLILVMGFGFIFGYLALSLNELETRTVDNAANYLEVTTSHNLAVAGENVALSILFQDSTLWNRTTDTVLMTETFTTGAFKNGDFTAYFKMVAGQPDQRLVRSASNYTSYGVTYHDTVETLFKRVTNWNILGLMIGFGGVGSDEWITKDTMWGRVQYNGRVGVHGSPVYMDKISVTKGFSPPVGTSTNQAIFKNGYETGVADMPLPALGDSSGTFPFADTTFIGDWSFQLFATLPLNNTGFIMARSGLFTYSGGLPRTYFYNVPNTKAGVILVRGNLSLQGVVDGQVTICATGSIYIDNDITYKVNPEITPSSDDMIGLVCINDLIFNAPAEHGKTLWNVQAVMSSLTGSLTATNLPNPPPDYAFRCFGGITGNNPISINQATGSSSPPNPYLKKGFYRRFHWDPRLGSGLRPPKYPVPANLPGALQLLSWWENVRKPAH